LLQTLFRIQHIASTHVTTLDIQKTTGTIGDHQTQREFLIFQKHPGVISKITAVVSHQAPALAVLGKVDVESFGVFVEMTLPQ